MSVYDRFGRLAFGSSTLPKDILEFIVFERLLTSPYGRWRMHDKIVPSWAPPLAPVIRSFVKPKPFKVDETAEKDIKATFKNDESHLPKDDEAPRLEQKTDSKN